MASAVTDGERKTVTALFADLKGSTELMESLDPEEARAIVDPALRIMVEAVRRYDGYVVQSTGDGIFALFGAPAAYEDHPQRALHAALQMQQNLRKYAQDVVDQGRPALEARFGVNTGEVVVRTVETGGKVEYTPIGHTANLASRLQTVASPGSIAVSDNTRALVEGYFELRALGPMLVRGISEPINVYEVTGPGPLKTHFQLSIQRGLTKFVGRERELAEMQRALNLAMSGHGQIVAVVAEAGTGKSRLLYEFKATLSARYKVLEAYSISHSKASAWLPVLDLLRGYFGIQQSDEPATRREKVRAALAVLDSALSDMESYLFALLVIAENPDSLALMDPQVRRKRTLEVLKRILLRESLKQPLVVIFEDLHWIDSETQALLDLLADGIANARILLLVNYRPEYRHEWGGKSYYAQFRLAPLGRESTEELIGALLGAAVELETLKRLIAEKTGGNPFFIEELVQTLFEEGVIVHNGTVKIVRSLSQLRLPATVQGILASRIDRLAAKEKDLLQMLAVIGRESPFDIIRKVTAWPDEELEPMLSALQAGEFMYEQPAGSGVEYIFKHALTQEVAYNSLLIERRKVLHERLGQTLEEMFAQQLDDHLTALAHHYSRSNNLEKAIEYLGRASQQELRRSAHVDAIRGFTTAIDLLQKLPENPQRIQRELPLQLALGQALIPVNGWASVEGERAFSRAQDICEQLQDSRALFGALFGAWSVNYLRGKLRPAYDLAEKLLERTQGTNDAVLIMRAHIALGDTLYSMGEFPRAREHFEEAMALYDPEQNREFAVDAGVSILCFLAHTLWLLGYPERALKRSNEALALAQARSHPHSLVFALGYHCGLRQSRREPRATQEAAESAIAISTEYGFTDFLPATACCRGWALSQLGKAEEGISQIEEGLAAARATGMELGRPSRLSMLAEAFMSSGRLDDGLMALAEAESGTNQRDERVSEAEIHWLKGELLLRQGSMNLPEAESCFRRAIEIARKQSAKLSELRATTSLARLLASRERRDGARTMLAEIYNWFTEGFDTAALKDAKVLLDELSE